MSSHLRNLKLANESVRTRGPVGTSQLCNVSRVSEGTDIVHIEPKSRGSRDVIRNEPLIARVVESVKISMPA